MGKLKFSLEQYQEAAVTYRSDLLMLPIVGLTEILPFVTSRPGVRYSERVGDITGEAQFAPYDPANVTEFDLSLNFRELRTYFGSVVANFEPNSAIGTLLGQGATKGDGQMSVPTALHVLALIAKSLSHKLNMAIWSAVRNPKGNTTQDLFDGYDTITEKEIADGNISAANRNLLQLDAPVTPANAVSVAKKILRAMDPELRGQQCYLYCTQDFLDDYNEGYQMLHGALPYNTEYGKTTVEGSDGRLVFCPLQSKAGSKFFHVSTKANMLIGYDQMGDEENVMVKEYKPFILSYIATMFFGVQFESIDPRRLLVVGLAA
ncbi:MAG: hypothetical protein K2O78_00135 [Muribaculaceae bacterium]|nr:hypothetical protein [Muribaculaceae bacterium]